MGSADKEKKEMYIDYSFLNVRAGGKGLSNPIVSHKVILNDMSNRADILIREAQHTF